MSIHLLIGVWLITIVCIGLCAWLLISLVSGLIHAHYISAAVLLVVSTSTSATLYYFFGKDLRASCLRIDNLHLHDLSSGELRTLLRNHIRICFVMFPVLNLFTLLTGWYPKQQRVQQLEKEIDRQKQAIDRKEKWVRAFRARLAELEALDPNEPRTVKEKLAQIRQLLVSATGNLLATRENSYFDLTTSLANFRSSCVQLKDRCDDVSIATEMKIRFLKNTGDLSISDETRRSAIVRYGFVINNQALDKKRIENTIQDVDAFDAWFRNS